MRTAHAPHPAFALGSFCEAVRNVDGVCFVEERVALPEGPSRMPGFELEQVDGGQPIDLPYGETVIGRGPFLGLWRRKQHHSECLSLSHTAFLLMVGTLALMEVLQFSPSTAKQDQAPAPKSSQERSLEDRLSEDSEEERKGRASKRAEAAPKSRAGGSTAEAGDSGNSEVKKLLSQNGKQSKKTSSSENSSSSSKPRVQCRTPCPYGTSCYRKNPVHFQECSHPGDDDFEEELSNSNEDDDDRPECPYGTDCYRKNPLHKKEYKHTKPPAKKSVPDDEDEDDDDEDRYENSFINDESEEKEVDEDSDYVPESDDGGKEDIKRLQKEAKAFLRRKK
ncbi:hypothetical protein SRHO_G00181930 [Serrasalmus rhombeus]